MVCLSDRTPSLVQLRGLLQIVRSLREVAIIQEEQAHSFCSKRLVIGEGVLSSILYGCFVCSDGNFVFTVYRGQFSSHEVVSMTKIPLRVLFGEIFHCRYGIGGHRSPDTFIAALSQHDSRKQTTVQRHAYNFYRWKDLTRRCDLLVQPVHFRRCVVSMKQIRQVQSQMKHFSFQCHKIHLLEHSQRIVLVHGFAGKNGRVLVRVVAGIGIGY
mmetsp:Transcript_26923/g.77645  ORF Transcript_26923/g.77645 Transcript_26923/m.77645 type:complete len:213 (-) Transcript_26923:1462-2100(-)